MATKNYVVRAGFVFKIRDEKGNEKTYTEGDTVKLDSSIGDEAHQLELVGKSASSDPVA